MIIGNFNASEDQLWKWFRIPGTDGEVELKLVTRDEMTALAKSQDLSLQARYVVNNLWRNFKNMRDRNGTLIADNTDDNRALMLTYRPLWAFVITKLTDLSHWYEEGKDGSGSAS